MLFEQEDVLCFFKHRKKTDVAVKSELMKDLLYFWQVQLEAEAVMHP